MRRIYPETNRLWQTLLLTAGLIAGFAVRPASGQTDPRPAPPRTAALTYEHQDYRSGAGPWSDWTTVTLAASVPVSGLNTTALLFRSERFARSDVGGGLDLYSGLWSRAYGNARLIVAPDASAVPRLDASAEVYQALGGAWEFSAGFRRMQFAENGVNIATLSAARYFSGWYAQARTTVVPEAGQTGLAFSGVLRRQLVAERFIELRAGSGEEVVTIASGPETALRDVRFILLRAQDRTLFSPSLGAMAGTGWQRFEGIPDRLDLSAGIIVTF